MDRVWICDWFFTFARGCCPFALPNVSALWKSRHEYKWDAVERCILQLEHLRIWEETSERLLILEDLKIYLIKPKFRTGQVVEASWNGVWHRVKILRKQDENSFEVRMLDGDPNARGEFKQIRSSKMRRSTVRIQSYRYVNITRFSNLGFALNGKVVSSVDYGGYAASKGIAQGWRFVRYALKPSFLRLLWDFCQAKQTYPEWKEVGEDGEEILSRLIQRKRVFLMGFFQPSIDSYFNARSAMFKRPSSRTIRSVGSSPRSLIFSIDDTDESEEGTIIWKTNAKSLSSKHSSGGKGDSKLVSTIGLTELVQMEKDLQCYTDPDRISPSSRSLMSIGNQWHD